MEVILPIPLIGITTSRSTSSTGLPLIDTPEAYVQAVSQAGACPVLIPLGLPESDLDRLASQLDGILFSGGGDVHPRRYVSPPHPLIAAIDEDRDRVEIHLIQASIQKEIPFLGICRGIQVINVALGGSLYADILDQRPEALKHDLFPAHSRDYLAHPVQVAGESRLGRILEEASLEVNSMHHQGIERPAGELEITALAPDGIIEGVELPGHPFGLAVQWHPEWLQGYAPMRRLFQAFVQAAAKGHRGISG